MKVKTPREGTICVSAQGRDKGTTYAVISVVSPQFVLVADGNRKKLSCPKRKNLKHLILTPRTAAEFGADISNGSADDCALAYAIKQYLQSKK